MEVLTIKQIDRPLKELNLPQVISLEQDLPTEEAIKIMQEKNFGSILVTKFGVLTGILTEKDFLFKGIGVVENFEKKPIEEFMTVNPFALKPDSTILEVIEYFYHHDFRHLPIVNDDGTPAYIISIMDILKFYIRTFPKSVKEKGLPKRYDKLAIFPQEEDFTRDVGEKELINGNIFEIRLLAAMNKHSLNLDLSISLQETLERLRSNNRGSAIFVQYETLLMGSLTERDILKKVLLKYDLDKRIIPITEIMNPNPVYLCSHHILAYALNYMTQFKIRNIILTNEDYYPLSFLNMLDIFKYISGKVLHKIEEDPNFIFTAA